MRAAVIVGPTAVGKSALAQVLAADRFEVVSADSVQVYRFMDIGSGKPSVAERERVPHHCIDIVDPDYPFTAGEFCRRADADCRGIHDRGRVPLVVGGTGLYIDSFFFGLSRIPPIDPAVRETLYRQLEERGLVSLYDELSVADPALAARIHVNDRQRILRGLEVYRFTGTPLSGFFDDGSDGAVSRETLFVGLELPRPALVRRIEERVDAMMAAGFVDEVAALQRRGYGPLCKSMRSIGYGEIYGYLDGAASLEETVDRIKAATRQYAKRQMTWFRKNQRVRWFHPDDREGIVRFVDHWFDG